MCAVVAKPSKIECFLLCLPSNRSTHFDKSTKYALKVKAEFQPQMYIASQHLQKRLSPKTMKKSCVSQLSIGLLIKTFKKIGENLKNKDLKKRKFQKSWKRKKELKETTKTRKKKQYPRSLGNQKMQKQKSPRKPIFQKSGARVYSQELWNIVVF